MKPLEQLIQETESMLEERWRRHEQAKTLPGPTDERRREAALHLSQMIPPALRAPRGELVKRVQVTHLIVAVSSWKWGEGNLMFRGRTEIGKTTAAALLLRRLLNEACNIGGETFKKAMTSRFVNARDLASSEKRHPLGAGESPEVVNAKNASLLVLDEVGPECDPAVLQCVLDWRYLHALPTCVTTGLTSKQLGEYFGSAIYRRMLDQGGQRGIIVESFNEPKARR